MQPVVHILDDDPSYIESLASLVGSLGFQTAGYTASKECLQRLDDSTPGCLILDLKMPEADGFSVLTALAERQLAPPVIVLTGHADAPSVVRAMRSGAVAFLQKHSLSETALLEAIQLAIDRDAERRHAFHRRQDVERRLKSLSVPEKLVLDLLVGGRDHTSVAEILGISRRTVENRRAKIMQKLDLSSFAELVQFMVDAESYQGGKKALSAP
jgi:FixJ family two-component response regulator